MSSASSEQSCVHEGAGYNEVFPSSLDDPSTSSTEREPSATSPSTGDEDTDVEGLEGDSNDDDFVNGEPPI